MIKLTEVSADRPNTVQKSLIKKEYDQLAKEIGVMCEKLYANKDRNLLVVFQGMDSSGKDGCTEHTFKYCSPLWVSAYGFKKPTDEEFAHDFLWRVHKQAPAKGTIKVFVRSHYEDILIQRVHKWIDEEHVTHRINAINAWEKNLTVDNNTTVLKFFLHLSKERQEEKLRERLSREDKFFKHNDGDWDEREHWGEYWRCYEDAMNRSEIPWIIVPANSRWYRNYVVIKKVHETLSEFNLKWPELDTERFKDGKS